MAITSFKGSLQCVIVLVVAPPGVDCNKILQANMQIRAKTMERDNRVIRLLLVTSISSVDYKYIEH